MKLNTHCDSYQLLVLTGPTSNNQQQVLVAVLAVMSSHSLGLMRTQLFYTAVLGCILKTIKTYYKDKIKKQQNKCVSKSYLNHKTKHKFSWTIYLYWLPKPIIIQRQNPMFTFYNHDHYILISLQMITWYTVVTPLIHEAVIVDNTI